jgi:hypothetical protein
MSGDEIEDARSWLTADGAYRAAVARLENR